MAPVHTCINPWAFRQKTRQIYVWVENLKTKVCPAIILTDINLKTYFLVVGGLHKSLQDEPGNLLYSWYG